MFYIWSCLKSLYSYFKWLRSIERGSNDGGSLIANKVVFIAQAMQNKVIKVLVKEVAIFFYI